MYISDYKYVTSLLLCIALGSFFYYRYNKSQKNHIKNNLLKISFPEAIKDAKKIAIIGGPGSGKSVLARKLQLYTNLPVYHLDQYFWGPNWTEPDRIAYKKIHDELCDRDQWIIEGLNLSLLEYRAKQADLIIVLQLPRMVCMWRTLKRAISYHGKETPSSAPGCKERIDWKFCKFLKWVWDYDSKYPPRIATILNTYADEKPVFVLYSQKEIDSLLAMLSE